MRFCVHTLGCKVNQYESQALEQAGLERGHTPVKAEDEAEVYIVNTCTVTNLADQKDRQLIRRLRREHPHALLCVCGCFPQTHPGQAEDLGADLVCGTGDRGKFWDLVDALRAGPEPSASWVDDAMKRRSFEELPAGGLDRRTRCMLKVEDGCVNFCSYCIIPYARGPVRSLPPDRAAAQAAEMARAGYKELVVTGIEISSWGRDLPGKPGLADLLEALSAAAPGLRIRLGSLEPRTIGKEFCRRISDLHNLCPHFHLSLQSGCDKTLKAMNRKYDSGRFFQSVELLREHYVNPGITTDLIVGFPGETETDFQDSLAFVEKCGFSALHVFPYSRRPGTPAAAMPGQVPNAEKKRRAGIAGQLAQKFKGQYLEGLVGQTLEVLFEEEKQGLWRGHAPNYTEVYAPGDGLHNILKQVRITRVQGGALLGEIQ